MSTTLAGALARVSVVPCKRRRFVYSFVFATIVLAELCKEGGTWYDIGMGDDKMAIFWLPGSGVAQ